MSENGQDKLLEKTMMSDEMDAGMAAELTDDALEDVSGGVRPRKHLRRPIKNEPVHDGKGRCCGQVINGKVFYRKCPSCGKPLYTNSGFFCCDTCKNKWGWVEQIPWGGTKESLAAFSNTNV